ncbi:hypothetical protein GCM10020000_49980 [Streptomyces olivoverticillatus]
MPAVIGALDAVSEAWAERFARALAPLRMADAAGAQGPHTRIAAALPRTARLLDELGLARATPASLTARWAAAMDRGARPGGRAVAVLGAGPHGPLAVDLAADGPHLLVEGGPGTGKTELLRSLAASLAAADRPDRLSLVLVDGAAAERGEGLRVCTDLPHVSTYLAAADPVRMREFAQALTSELKRRAELLGTLDFTAWHDRHGPAYPAAPPNVVGPPPPRRARRRRPRSGAQRHAQAAHAARRSDAYGRDGAAPPGRARRRLRRARRPPALGSTGRSRRPVRWSVRWKPWPGTASGSASTSSPRPAARTVRPIRRPSNGPGCGPPWRSRRRPRTPAPRAPTANRHQGGGGCSARTTGLRRPSRRAG